MKSLILMMTFLLAFACTTESAKHSFSEDESNKALFQRDKTLDTVSLSSKVKSVIVRWWRDSLGCLGERQRIDGYTLYDEFSLNGASKERVAEILGMPSSIETHGRSVNGIIDDYLTWEYYCSSICAEKEGKMEVYPNSEILIFFSPKTRRVIGIEGIVY